jgi:hypothetical protein
MATRGSIKITSAVGRGLELAIERKGSVRIGATVDPERRAREYELEGFSGIMRVQNVSNMRNAEDNLLRKAKEVGAGRHNRQSISNMPEAPGYVYVIEGRKLG